MLSTAVEHRLFGGVGERADPVGAVDGLRRRRADLADDQPAIVLRRHVEQQVGEADVGEQPPLRRQPVEVADLLTVERGVFPDESRKRCHHPQSAVSRMLDTIASKPCEVVDVAGQRFDIEHLRRQGGELGSALRFTGRDEGDVVEALGDPGEHVSDDVCVDLARAPLRARQRAGDLHGQSVPAAASASRVALAAAARDVSAGGITRLAMIAPTG